MQRNITFDLIDHARIRPDAPALLLPRRTISYRELDGLVWRYAQRLHALGVRPGQTVGITFHEELGLVLTLLALGRLGATAYSIPRSATASQRQQMARCARLNWHASDQPERDQAGTASLRLARQEIESMPPGADHGLMVVQPEAAWLLITGSGSTGNPKLIPVSHAQGRARSALGARALGLTTSDRVAALSHFDFSTSKFRLHEALWAGAACALELWTDPRQVLQRCASAGLTVLYGTVFHAEKLLESLPAGSRNMLATLRAFELTASTVSDELRRRIRQALTSQLYVRYGINEAGPVAVVGPSEVYQTAGTVGRPPDGVELQVVDRRGQALPPGTVGQVRIRTPAQIDGYRDDDAATRTSFQDGWFLPGDLGRLTSDGQLVYYGRADHMMIMNGINIYPAEIEQTMADHPDVADAAVMPVRHRIHQDIPVCAVTLKAGSQVSEQSLLEHARSRLGARGPQGMLVLDRIPRNHEHKLARAELLRLIQNRLAQPVARAAAPSLPQTTRLRQRAQPIRHQFALSAQADPQRIDAWLAAVLEASDSRPIITAAPISTSRSDLALACLVRALLLARWLLQAGRMPVFDPPRVKALQQIVVTAPVGSSSQLWRADLTLGLVEHLPVEAYVQALSAAFELCELATRLELTDSNLARFHDRADQARGILSRFMPAGKSTLPLLRAAYELDIPFTHLGGGVFQLGWGSQSCLMHYSTTRHDSALGARLAHSKVQTADLLRQAGLPAPEHQVVNRMPLALTAAQALGWPVVIKPADRERGEGVSVDVSSQSQLMAAFARAQQLSPTRQVIVERQVAGCCHRLFIARGKLLYAVKRLPMSVTADGRHNIAELVDAEVRKQQRLPPWVRSGIRPIDDLALMEITAAGLTLTSIPAAGSRIPLRRIESTEWGGVDEDVSDVVHPENLRIAIQAAGLLGLDMAGIDIITPDIGRPWFENGAIINEVNYSPQLGGGDISRRQIPALLAQLVPGQGRIPIEVFVGSSAAWTAASLRWQQLLADGLNAFLSSATLTLDPSGAPLHLPWTGCHPRARALALSTDVDALVLVIPAGEFATVGLPFAQVGRIVRKDGLLPPLPTA